MRRGPGEPVHDSTCPIDGSFSKKCIVDFLKGKLNDAVNHEDYDTAFVLAKILHDLTRGIKNPTSKHSNGRLGIE